MKRSYKIAIPDMATFDHNKIVDNIRFRHDTGCWEWTAGKFTQGYGAVHIGNRTVGAHRASYELFIGKIPDGLQLDHLCRNRGCVNPFHLEPVSESENVQRGAWARFGHTAGICVNGHAGRMKRRKRGSVYCLECVRLSTARNRERNKPLTCPDVGARSQPYRKESQP